MNFSTRVKPSTHVWLYVLQPVQQGHDQKWSADRFPFSPQWLRGLTEAYWQGAAPCQNTIAGKIAVLILHS